MSFQHYLKYYFLTADQNWDFSWICSVLMLVSHCEITIKFFFPGYREIFNTDDGKQGKL